MKFTMRDKIILAVALTALLLAIWGVAYDIDKGDLTWRGICAILVLAYWWFNLILGMLEEHKARNGKVTLEEDKRVVLIHLADQVNSHAAYVKKKTGKDMKLIVYIAMDVADKIGAYEGKIVGCTFRCNPKLKPGTVLVMPEDQVDPMFRAKHA